MMLHLWDLTDRRALGPSAFIPQSTVEGPATFRSQIVLHLTIPPPEKPSLFKFHTDTYSPPPIRKPKVSHIKHDRFPPGLPRVPHMTSFPDFPPSPKYA
ncbi:hypothetical protein BD410DRAFT_786420 [Rickenella mellea]|uniref:Uncharacterized protein n=1 Tax=Rickenella mellea TaxID=50990 RepID=A0A4Y7QAP6_9AGAM|nr:hypothetical protein BD410DRAFT_786420 [Rickenella mellea]